MLVSLRFFHPKREEREREEDKRFWFEEIERMMQRTFRRLSERMGPSRSMTAAVKGMEREKIFQRGQNVHMYANKEKAFESHEEDRYYGLKRFKEFWQRMMKDTGTKYYVLGTLLLMAGAGGKLWMMQEEMKTANGLLGPKKKTYRSRLTIVLDLDESIVSYGDKAFRMKGGMIPRPYLAELLDYLCKIDAEVILWSACSERYMNQVLQVIDPSGQRISQTITRSNDWFTKDFYYEKNLSWIGRDMDNTLLIENRPLAIRNCNANAILVDDFIRGEYMDTGQDHPVNDRALRIIKEIIEGIETSGKPVPQYLEDVSSRHKEIKEIPCHLAFRQMPDELARGVFYFVGDKYRGVGSFDNAAAAGAASNKNNSNNNSKTAMVSK